MLVLFTAIAALGNRGQIRRPSNATHNRKRGYHAIASPLCQKRPVGTAEVARRKISSAGWAASRGAPSPPMSVLTHPGETMETVMFRPFSRCANFCVYIDSAALEIE